MKINVKPFISLKPKEKILIIALQGIGNALFLFPLIKELVKNFPQNPVDVVVRNESCRMVLDDGKSVRNFFILPLRFFSLLYLLKILLNIRSNRYAVSFLAFPANHPFFNIISFLCNAKYRVSFDYTWHGKRNLNFLNNLFISLDKTHDYYQNLSFLKILGYSETIKLNKYLLPFTVKPCLKTNCIGIHPGSSKDRAMKEKRWSVKCFRELIMRLSKKNFKILLFFGPDEDELKKEFTDLVSAKVLILSGLKLNETLSYMAGLKLFIANDSGLMNLASAMGKRVLNIAGGPTDPVRTYPVSKGSFVIFSTIHCYPCRGLKNTGKPFSCIYSKRLCLEEITVDRVETLVNLMLDK